MQQKNKLNKESHAILTENKESERAEGKICENCNSEIPIGKEFCPECGSILVSTMNSEWKNSTLAAGASLLWAGLGQVYNGETAKGFVTIISQITFTLMAITSFNLLFILPLTLLVWSVYDAYATAEIINFLIAIDRERISQETLRNKFSNQH